MDNQKNTVNNLQQKILERNVAEEMRDSFLEYSMSVIVSRALPDARDGLKPVHRRILFAMHELNNYHDKPTKKSARIVGEVMGKYHPHGDMAIYDAMSRMTQDWAYRYPLIEGQGNYGSIDGDAPASMRYTEARMSKLASEMIKGINPQISDFIGNYDNSEREPVVLPALFPNLLVNGATGIAVGMATNIPPHNLCEIIDAVKYVLNKPDCEIIELFEIVKGPDFPTGATIIGESGIKNAYLYGKGTIVLRSKISKEKINNKWAIVVTEIPYQVNKMTLIEKILEMINNKKISFISNLYDLSNLKGIKIVIEVKKEEYLDLVINQLYKFTPLQSSFHVNMLSLYKGQPLVMNLKKMIDIYIEHRLLLILKKALFFANKIKDQIHILEGLIIAINNIDETVNLIKASNSPEVAINNLINKFTLSPKQAKAILEMKLQRLTGLEKLKLQKEWENLKVEYDDLQDIINKETRRKSELEKELENIKTVYGDARKTDISQYDEEILDEDLIKKEDCVISISTNGYIKRIPLITYKTQNRGGKGIIGANLDDDLINKIIIASTHSDILFFTNRGRVYKLRAHQIPSFLRTAKGNHIINLIKIEKNEAIQTVISVNDDDTKYNNFFFVTKLGIVKRCSLVNFKSIYANGKIAISLNEDDELLDVVLTTNNNEILIASNQGLATRFNENEVRIMGRTAAGVKGINLNKGKKVVGICTNDEADLALTVSANGYSKFSYFDEFRLTKRGSKGVIAMNINNKTGPLVAIKTINSTQKDVTEALVMTAKGNVVRFPLSQVNILGRNSIGVISLRFKKEEDSISSVALTENQENSLNEE